MLQILSHFKDGGSKQVPPKQRTTRRHIPEDCGCGHCRRRPHMSNSGCLARLNVNVWRSCTACMAAVMC
jgi:hypothetical protein